MGQDEELRVKAVPVLHHGVEAERGDGGNDLLQRAFVRHLELGFGLGLLGVAAGGGFGAGGHLGDGEAHELFAEAGQLARREGHGDVRQLGAQGAHELHEVHVPETGCAGGWPPWAGRMRGKERATEVRQ